MYTLSPTPPFKVVALGFQFNPEIQTIWSGGEGVSGMFRRENVLSDILNQELVSQLVVTLWRQEIQAFLSFMLRISTDQNNFADGNVSFYIENPVNRFVACKHENNRSVWFSMADNIDSSVTGLRRSFVYDFIHRQYVAFILCGTLHRNAAIYSQRLFVNVIQWFGKGCLSIQNDFTSMYIS